MKKSKLILVLAAVLALTCVLSACGLGKTAEFGDVCVNGAYTDESTTYTKAELINVAGDFSTSEYGIALFVDDSGEQNVYRFYNMMTGAVVQTVTNTATVVYNGFDAIEVNDGVVFTIQLKDTTTAWNTKYTTTLYKADGTQIASVAKQATATFNYSADLLVFNNTYYPVDTDGNIGEGFEYSAAAAVPTIDQASANYYYDFNGRVAYVYDKQFNLVAEYSLPGYAEEFEEFFFVLENGNILVQYLIIEPDDAEDYDVFFEDSEYFDIDLNGMDGGFEFNSNVKATVVSQLIDVEKDKIKDIDLDFIVVDLSTKTDIAEYGYTYLTEEIENVATVLEIVDGRVDDSEANAKMISLSNKCKAEMVLNDVFVAQGDSIPYLVAENRYMLRDATGARYIVNEKGEKLGRIDNATNGNEAYFVCDGKIYNYDCAVVLDYEKEGYLITGTLAKGFIMTKVVETGVETYAFFNGTATKIIDAGDLTKTVSVDSSRRYYIVVTDPAEGDTTYTYYNDCGAQFASVTGSALIAQCSADDGNVRIFSYYDAANSKTVYYRVA